MQFESLKVFCDVARQRSFSRAAAANHVSQSAASQVVSQLEKRLGVQLINRSTRPLQLTPPGQRYYEGCKGLVEQYLELEVSVRNAASQLAPTVEVAAIYSVGLSDLGQSVERFQTEHAPARAHVEYLHPDRVIEKVLDGTADFGLVSFPRKTRELTALPWKEETMVLACAPGHTLAGLPAIEPRQLTGAEYVAFNEGLVIRREVDRFLREQGAATAVKAEFDNIENIKQAIVSRVGVALLPEPTLRREVAAGTLVAVPLAGGRFARPLGIIHRRRRKPSATAQQFMELLRRPEPKASSGSPEQGQCTHDSGPPSPPPTSRRPGRGANGAGHRGRNGNGHASTRDP
jgi:DNA-binding transcriptional LysR family regulator